MKPTTGRSEFGGLVVRSTHDLWNVTRVDDELPVFSATPVDMTGRTEWRCFVIDGRTPLDFAITNNHDDLVELLSDQTKNRRADAY